MRTTHFSTKSIRPTTLISFLIFSPYKHAQQARADMTGSWTLVTHTASLSLVLLFQTFTGESTQSAECKTIKFLSYFPCTSVTDSTSFEKCDVFAYVAAQVAVDRINNDPKLAVNITLVPIATGQVYYTTGQLIY